MHRLQPITVAELLYRSLFKTPHKPNHSDPPHPVYKYVYMCRTRLYLCKWIWDLMTNRGQQVG